MEIKNISTRVDSTGVHIGSDKNVVKRIILTRNIGSRPWTFKCLSFLHWICLMGGFISLIICFGVYYTWSDEDCEPTFGTHITDTTRKNILAEVIAKYIHLIVLVIIVWTGLTVWFINACRKCLVSRTDECLQVVMDDNSYFILELPRLAEMVDRSQKLRSKF